MHDLLLSKLKRLGKVEVAEHFAFILTCCKKKGRVTYVVISKEFSSGKGMVSVVYSKIHNDNCFLFTSLCCSFWVKGNYWNWSSRFFNIFRNCKSFLLHSGSFPFYVLSKDGFWAFDSIRWLLLHLMAFRVWDSDSVCTLWHFLSLSSF